MTKNTVKKLCGCHTASEYTSAASHTRRHSLEVAPTTLAQTTRQTANNSSATVGNSDRGRNADLDLKL